MTPPKKPRTRKYWERSPKMTARRIAEALHDVLVGFSTPPDRQHDALMETACAAGNWLGRAIRRAKTYYGAARLSPAVGVALKDNNTLLFEVQHFGRVTL